jgi:hypothetical protein
MGDLDRTLPVQITQVAIRSGEELVFPLDEAKRVIRIADQTGIAVLGVEAFRILEDGLGVETYSGYEFNFDGD